jgi:hypothetical protein
MQNMIMILKSNNLEKLLRKEMVLQLLSAARLPLLNTGITAGSFHTMGEYY